MPRSVTGGWFTLHESIVHWGTTAVAVPTFVENGGMPRGVSLGRVTPRGPDVRRIRPPSDTQLGQDVSRDI